MDDANLSPEVLERRRMWFDRYTRSLSEKSIVKPAAAGQRYACPCCLFFTLDERGAFDICQVCFWEDDGQDDHDADVVRGGPNGTLSLTVARSNFAVFGACEERLKDKVRLPLPG